METKFIQSVLFGTAILVVYALVSPRVVLSAQASPMLNPGVHVRKGVVTQIDPATNALTVDFDGTSVLVSTNASTTVTSPNGETTELAYLRDGSSVYVFGDYDTSVRRIEARKIVMRNPSILSRENLSNSQAETAQNGNTSTSSVLDALSLTAR